LIFVCITYYSICYSQTDSLKADTSKKLFDPSEQYNFHIIFRYDYINYYDSLTVRYNQTDLHITAIHQLDDYFKDNIKKIDRNRVLLETNHKSNIDTLKALQTILNKYKIYKYFKVQIE